MTPKLTKVTRLDSVPIQAFYTEEGYLKDKPILTSTGIFEYANPDGSIRRELRLPEDVFAPDSLASYEGKPIIITHDAGLVTKENVHEYQVGTVLSKGERSGDDVRASIIIHDTDEMKKRGLKELSLGYNLDLEEEPGEWNGLKYDAIQRNIRINHLALVREARAGEQARLNIDSSDGITTLKGGKLMSKVIRNARRDDEALTPDELQKAIEWYKQNRDTIAGGSSEQKDSDEETIEDKISGIRENHSENQESDKPEFPENKMSLIDKPEEKPEEAEDEPEEKPEEKPVVDKPEDEPEEDPDEKQFDAEEVIKDQDKDIKTLLDIIDTLLAERAFDEADKPEKEEEEEEEEEIIFDEEDVEEEEDEFAAFEEDECEDKPEEDEFADYEEDGADSEIPDADENSFPMDDCGDYEARMDSIDRIVKERIRLGMIGRQLNLDGLENMSVISAKKAIIKVVRPSVNLDGKSAVYVGAMFDCAVEDLGKRGRKTTDDQRKQMFNKDSAAVELGSSTDARQKMIERHSKK